MKGIDIFSGAGGMSVGAAMAGVDIITAVEKDQYAAKTYALNHKNTNVICDSIEDIADFGGLRPKGECILFGGPPCQGFSTSNQRTRSMSNQNNWMFKEFLRAVKQAEPDWVVFENVKGILETENALFLNFVLEGLKNLGYTTNHFLLNAADFGVPQNRARLFIIGSLKGREIQAPISTLRKKVTVQDAFCDLLSLENGANDNCLPYARAANSTYARLLRGKLKECTGHLVTRNAPHIVQRYKHIPQGGNWENIPDKLMGTYKDKSRCHTGIYRRLKLDEPSVVIGNYRKNMLIHPTEDRGLSVREAARLQSFPDNYIFSGSIGFQQQQVGNAVPPLLAQALFTSLMKQAEGGK